MKESPYPMLSVDEARRRVLERTPPRTPVRVPLRHASGLVLAAPVTASFAIPSFAAATVDGFAVIAADASPRRRLIGEQFAGYVVGLRVEPGTAVRVTTGAPVPPGADAVVMVEVTDERDGVVTLREGVKPGSGIRPIGSDVQTGQEVLAAGTVIGAAELGLLASVGLTEVSVYPRVRVAVLSTGDELVEPGQPLQPGQIYDSNRFSLMAAIQDLGAEPVDAGSAGDRRDVLEAKVRAALQQADALITSGAVSMGELDLLKPLLAEQGDLFVGRVNLRPGKPLTFATVQGKPVFALPGNPVSSLVTFEMFARPAFLQMQGHRHILRPRIRARLAHPVRHPPDRLEYQRAIATWRDGEFYVATTGAQTASRLLSLVGANALVELADGRSDFAEGEAVDVLMIGAWHG